MKKPTIAAVLCFCLAFGATVARAQFGLGITVFDPSVYAEAVAEVSHLIQQYNQLVQTYQMITNQYNQMVWMAKTLPANLANFRAIRTPWFLSSATNTYGLTGGWIAAINSGSNVLGGYQSATDPLQAYGAALGNVPADQLSRTREALRDRRARRRRNPGRNGDDWHTAFQRSPGRSRDPKPRRCIA